MIGPYVKDMKSILGINTYCLYFNQKVNYNKKIFKEIEVKPFSDRNSIIKYNEPDVKIIEAEAGHGKSRFICQSANKQSDGIIVVSN